MSNIKEVHGQLCQHLSGVARLRRRCRAYAPRSNTASDDNHESSYGFPFLSYMSMGLRLADLRAAGALHAKIFFDLLLKKKNIFVVV